jgi:fructoselysine-6-P-deglycase FrlB-like protein
VRPDLFAADLAERPAALRALADVIDAADPYAAVNPAAYQRILLLGMGSSGYAAGVGARRLRAAGVPAVADYASATETWPPGPATLVVAVSATGGSAELLATLEGFPAAHTVAVTNVPDSPITALARHVVPMHAGVERSGIACRTYTHTLALMLALAARAGARLDRHGVAEACRRAAEATDDLLQRRDQWLGAVAAALDGPDGVYAIAPVERLASAQQAALMIREIPRRAAVACETADWSHVDVYLTTTLDYRTLLFPGSRHDSAALEWLTSRKSTIVSVGTHVPGAVAVVRFHGDDDPLVCLLTESLIGELVADAWGPR